MKISEMVEHVSGFDYCPQCVAIKATLLKLEEWGKRAREIEAYTENRITKAWMTGGLLKDIRDFGEGEDERK